MKRSNTDRVDIGIGELDMRDALNPHRIEARKNAKKLLLACAAGALVGAGMFVSARER